MIDRKEFRDAMAGLGAAVNVITTAGETGPTGFTASAVCSVTDDPPTLLVCMNRNSRQNKTFKDNGVLCVNVLTPAQERLSGVFAGMTGTDMAERFKAATWGRLATGAPVLQGAAVSLDCRISQAVEVGTHSVLFCEVEAICDNKAGAGLIYLGRRYHHVHVDVPRPLARALPECVCWSELPASN